MKIGDKLTPIAGNTQSYVIISTPKPPAKWKIKCESGKEKMRSKSHLKKYYKVAEK